MAETTTSTITEPDNDATVDAIRADLRRMQHPESVSPYAGEDDAPHDLGGLPDI
jgi:hypothetical protein